QIVRFPVVERWNSYGAVPLGGTLAAVAPSFGVHGGWHREVQHFDLESGRFAVNVAEPGYREMMGLFTGWLAEGLLDPDLTAPDEVAIEAFLAGDSAMILTTGDELARMLELSAAAGGPPLAAEMIALPAGPAGYRVMPGQIGPGFVLNAAVRNHPNFVAILQFLDWLYFSEEGLRFALWGVEGRTFEFDAEHLPTYLAPAAPSPPPVETEDDDGEASDGADEGQADDEANREAAAEPASPTAILQQRYGFGDSTFSQSQGGTRDNVLSLLPPAEVNNARAWYLAATSRVTALPLPPNPLLDEEAQAEFDALVHAVQDAIEQGVAALLLQVTPLSEWNEWIAEVRGAGADRLVALLNGGLSQAPTG
ncbi:MAG: hypothetical protein FWG11_08525, partial [Promicromonosporaceae bacterium]|nr:hypothetical protein [Promicromonosporaceae bacterium]